MLLELAPSQIRFMQDSIHPSFRGGGNVNKTIDDICERRKNVKDIPMIEVTELNNKYYSLDNRRLYLFRVLQKRGYLSRIDVLLVSRWEEHKFTTNNDGASVEVRRGATYPHTFVVEPIRNSFSPAIRTSTEDTVIDISEDEETLLSREFLIAREKSVCEYFCTIL